MNAGRVGNERGRGRSLPRRPGHPSTNRRVTLGVILAGLALVTLAPIAAGARPGSDGTRGKVAGLAVTPLAVTQPILDAELGRVRHTGVNTVTVDVWWDVDPVTQSHLYPGEITASDEQLANTIRSAQAQGLRAILVPKLWCPGCMATDRHNWVGKIHPMFRDQFFADYRAFINRYASLAQANRVWLYVIGHEMNSLQGEEGQFRRVAAEVRRRYKGLICYGMDWSALAGYAPPVRFWDAVDVIGVSAYFPLSDAVRPSVDELRSAWHASSARAFYGYRWFDKLAALAQATHRPVFFPEVGYVSSNYAGQAPGDPNHKATEPNQVVQANAYQALLQTFEPQPWWLGVVWWEWEQHSDNGAEPDYSPRNKMAERFLTYWYAAGWRPG